LAEYVTGSPGAALRVGILPSAFNPPTIAHFALADAAQQFAGLDQVVFALPSDLPHKSFEGASHGQRIEMLQAAVEGQPGRGVVLTDGGLFVEIARELKDLHRRDAEIFLICGKDAARRIAAWDYGDGPAFDDQLEEFTMLVGDREGRYLPAARWGDRVRAVALPEDLEFVSSAELRRRRCRDEDWQALTVRAISKLIEQWNLYRESAGG
jgi:nicotinate-nucleotide adenylyltransferase